MPPLYSTLCLPVRAVDFFKLLCGLTWTLVYEYQGDNWITVNSTNTTQGYYYQNFTIDGKTFTIYADDSLGEERNYCHNTDPIGDADVLKGYAECLNKRYFVWGLSSIMVYIMLSSQIVWM